MRTLIATLAAMWVICAPAHAGSSKRIRLLSVTFVAPFNLQVEGAGTEEIFAMNAKQCESHCPPVVMAWECRFTTVPMCADLNRQPPADLCGDTAATEIRHSAVLKETRWICPDAVGSDGSYRVGFSIFDLAQGQLVVSYLGGMKDVAPAQFMELVARSIRVR